MPKYASYVKFTARTGQRAALADLLLKAAESLKDIAGCEFYVINTQPDQPDVVWVTEVWASEADSQAALNVEGGRENIQRVIALLAAAPEKIALTPLGGKGLGLIQVTLAPPSTCSTTPVR